MSNGVTRKQYRAIMFVALSIAASVAALSQFDSAANAEPAGFQTHYSSGEASGSAESDYLIKISDDDYRYNERGRYDNRDSHAAHEAREQAQREHSYSHEDAERARRDYLHHEHEEHEHRNHYEH
jgi:hypothetical protein